MTILSVDNVYKSFQIPEVRRDTVREHLLKLTSPKSKRKLEVLRGVSFNLKQGESLGIMGANGCGKSTLLKLICGVYTPDRGRITVSANITPILELGVGWNQELNPVDNILLTTTAMGVNLKDAKAMVEEILDFAELEQFAELQLKYFSSGMSARLAYATAFCAVNEILVLDEVFAVGDASFMRKCQKRFNQLHQAGHTMVLVSHRAEIVEKYCNRAILIENGSVINDDLAQNVAANYTELQDNITNDHPLKSEGSPAD